MTVSMTCKYCGNHWTLQNIYRNPNAKIVCSQCGDTDIIVKDYEKSRIDYYAGSPEFPVKKKNNDWSFD